VNATTPSNTRIWDALGKTDPDHTKRFSRAGGFKGTSVKPVWCERRMTEHFGPCGLGWGMSEPNYQLVNSPDGAVAVYCWLSLWYIDPETGARSEPILGVGGDFAVVKQQSGLRADDEAFKKATTDALGNAMKRIGVAADIHMGRHDDDKYVEDTRREFDQEEQEQHHADRMATIAGFEDEARSHAAAALDIGALNGVWKSFVGPRLKEIDDNNLTQRVKVIFAERKAALQPAPPVKSEPVPKPKPVGIPPTWSKANAAAFVHRVVEDAKRGHDSALGLAWFGDVMVANQAGFLGLQESWPEEYERMSAELASIRKTLAAEPANLMSAG